MNSADLLENRLSPIVQGLADIVEFTFLDGPVQVCDQFYDTYAVCVCSCCQTFSICSCLLRMDSQFNSGDGGKLAAHHMKGGRVC